MLKHQCRPRLKIIVCFIDQIYHATCNVFKPTDSSLKPNGEQQRPMRRLPVRVGTFTTTRRLRCSRRGMKWEKRSFGYAALCKALTKWKAGPETSAWNEPQVCSRRQKNLERACNNFFEKRAGSPRFKKASRTVSAILKALNSIRATAVFPSAGWLRYRNSRDVRGEVKNATISQSGGKWFISIQTGRSAAAFAKWRGG